MTGLGIRLRMTGLGIRLRMTGLVIRLGMAGLGIRLRMAGLGIRLRMTGLVILLTMVALGACSKLESYFVDKPIAAGIDSPDKDVAEYLQGMLQSARAMETSGLARGRLAMAYDVNGLREAALATYQQAEVLDPDDFRWPYFSAQLVAEGGDHAQALSVLRRALEIDEEYAPAWAWRGTWLLKVGLPDDALAAFDRAANLTPDRLPPSVEPRR